MFKKNKTIKSDKSIKGKLYAKTFSLGFVHGFAESITDVPLALVTLIGSGVLNRQDIANDVFGSTFKTAGLVSIGSGVYRGVMFGVIDVICLKNDIAELSEEEISNLDVDYYKED